MGYCVLLQVFANSNSKVDSLAKKSNILMSWQPLEVKTMQMNPSEWQLLVKFVTYAKEPKTSDPRTLQATGGDAVCTTGATQGDAGDDNGKQRPLG